MKQLVIKQLVIIILTVIILGILFMSMDGSDQEYKSNNIPEYEISPTSNIHRCIIDSCEYIVWNQGLAHKGNCKFCAERRKKENKDIHNK